MCITFFLIFFQIISVSDMLKIQYETNYHYVGTRVTVQVNKIGLSTAVSLNISDGENKKEDLDI